MDLQTKVSSISLIFRYLHSIMKSYVIRDMYLKIWSRVSSHRPCFWRKVCDCLHHAFLIFQQHFLDLSKSLAAGGFITSADVPMPLPVCAPHINRSEGLFFVLFPPYSVRGFLDLPLEATFIHKISIQLMTPENLFWSLPACHSARRAFMPEVAESITATNGFCDSA